MARVTYVNHTGKSLDPFCGGNGARVVDTDGQAYRTVEGLYDIPGNDVICGPAHGTPAGGTQTVTLVFRLHRGARVAAVELFNGLNGDYDGDRSLVRFEP